MVERYARLVEAQPDTSIPVPASEWTVRDAAVHLAGGNYRHIAYATGGGATAPGAPRQPGHLRDLRGSAVGVHHL